METCLYSGVLHICWFFVNFGEIVQTFLKRDYSTSGDFSQFIETSVYWDFSTSVNFDHFSSL